MSRLEVVNQDLSLDEYRELAEIRCRIRCFQGVTERNAVDLGIDPESYPLLLAIQGLPEGVPPTVKGLAERMCLEHDKLSKLLNAAVTQAVVTRSSTEGSEDWVKLTRNGREVLRRMAIVNREELERTGPDLVRSLQTILKHRRGSHRTAS